jgi:hypothetical protein
MVAGGLMASLAFFIAAIIELELQVSVSPTFYAQLLRP